MIDKRALWFFTITKHNGAVGESKSGKHESNKSSFEWGLKTKRVDIILHKRGTVDCMGLSKGGE